MKSMVYECLFLLLVGVCSLGQAGIAMGSSTGLIVDYPFGSGMSWADGERVHGTTLVDNRFGDPGGASSFDGINDWVEVDLSDSFLNFDQDWSINMWAYLDGSGRHMVFFAGADGDAGARQFVMASRYVKLTNKADTDADWRVNFKEPPHDSWHMYSMTWSKKGLLKVFVDGVLQGEDSDGALKDFCPKNMPVIGAVNFPRKNQFFKGKLDDFRVYERTLSASEIGVIYGLQE